MGDVRRVDFGSGPEAARALEARRTKEKQDALAVIRPILDLLRKKFIRELQTVEPGGLLRAHASLPPCLHEAYQSGNIFRDVDRWEFQFKNIGQLLGQQFARWELDIVYNPSMIAEIPKPIKEIIADNFEPEFLVMKLREITEADPDNTFLKNINNSVSGARIFPVRLGSLGITSDDLR
ncbi:MAG TPA: hypothetical protein VJH75_00815 [Patescibacteria group bacterium]|nr:hypothetical protein [Patescibacteria group bacterium]